MDSEWRAKFDEKDVREGALSRSQSTFDRLRYFTECITRQRSNDKPSFEYHAAPVDEESDEAPLSPSFRRRRRSSRCKLLRLLKRGLLYLPIVTLSLFGLLHVLLVILGRIQLFWSVEPYTTYVSSLYESDLLSLSGGYPTDATRDIVPIACHSHNDYWRAVPLFDAIRSGCTGVEADVWLFKDEAELFVGHTSAALSPGRTLRSLYVEPLVELLDRMNPTTEFYTANGNGVFDKDPLQTLVLLIDFKTNGDALYPRVREQLEPLRKRDYLSHFDGQRMHRRAVTIVATGNVPFNRILEDEQRRDIFFDAPLDQMWQSQPETAESSSSGKKEPGQRQTSAELSTAADTFNATNSYYASVSFATSIGQPWVGRLTSKQLDRIRGQIRGAQQRGLKARYWDTPTWPTSLRNYIWQILVAEGADVLNVDDLVAAATQDWTDVVGRDWFDA